MYEPPRGEVEEILAGIWQELLGVERVGRRDNFFELGGHSLLAVHLSNAVQRKFEHSLSLRQFMEEPTLERLARDISENTGTQRWAPEQIVPHPEHEQEPFPLTAVQLAYWIGRQGAAELGNVGAHSYREIPLTNLDIPLFEQVLNRLIRRHGMLRMVVIQGEQRILPTVPEYRVRVDDYRALDQGLLQERLAEVRAQMSHQVFSGEQWPLFELRISIVSDARAILHCSTDALVLDASSSVILNREWTELYADPLRDLPALQLSFRDYVLALQQFASTPAHQEARRYWTSRAQDFPGAPELPLAIDPAQIIRPRFERRRQQLPASQWQALISRAKRHQVTPTALLLSCFAEVVTRWTGQSRFALNLTLFNRTPLHPQVDQIVGDFTTLTLLEVNSEDPARSFVERLRATQRQLWSDLEHRHFDGLEMLQVLRRTRGHAVSYPIVVTSTLGLSDAQLSREQQSERASVTASDGESEAYSLTQTPQVWLDVQVYEQGDGLGYNWDSVVGLFPEGMLDAMFWSFTQLLERLAQGESSWESAIQAELPPHQVSLMEQTNATHRTFPDGTLHGPLLRQIEHQRDKPAVRTATKTLSYEELGQRSALLAQRLLSGGARRNRLIAVVMEKGWQQVVAVLGILRAGGAYLPIDASLPRQRIAFMLASGEVEQVVTTARHATCIPAEYPGIYLVDEESIDEVAPAQSLDCDVEPQDLAYVIFTSGSTGVPKGVMIEHRAALNTVLDINERYGVGAADTVLGLSNLSFDLSVYDIFGVLGAGGTLVLPRAEEYRDPGAWVNYLRGDGHDGQVTVWNTVPALLQMFVESLDESAPAFELRLVLLSGDWIPVQLPDQVRAFAPRARVISLGGATEASIWSIAYPIGSVDRDWNSIPYGKALANQQVHVLQRDLAPAPVWVRGELYIGGTGLARGYWHDEPKTASSFIHHPHRGERLYRTGDQGRWLPDGNIEFLGREDQQVKIQGHRIELGEIEARLKLHPGISDAIVTVHRRESTRQLIAYVVATTSHDSLAGKLEFKLAQKALRDRGERHVLQLPMSSDESLALHAPREQITEYPDEPIELQALGQLLHSCLRRALSGRVFAKAFYPSGGTLYPVQVYVQLAAHRVRLPTGEFAPAGYYYYHPLTHELMELVKPDASARPLQAEPEVFRLFLVADLAAIEPIYGTMSQELCALEAGYLSQLLECNRDSGLVIRAEEVPASERLTIPETGEQHRLLRVYSGGRAAATATTIDVAAELGADQVEIIQRNAEGCGFTLSRPLPGVALSRVARKSYRNYLPEAPALEELALMLLAIHEHAGLEPVPLKIYIQLRKVLHAKHSEHRIEPGLYVYDPYQPRLRAVSAGDDELVLFTGESRVIERSSAFSVLLVGRREKPEEKFTAAGMLGQLLSNYGIPVRVGTCPLGLSPEQQVGRELGLSAEERLYHALVGGAVSAAQIAAVEESSAAVDLEREVLEFLRDGLPDYMIPQELILMPRLPLTPNGKVDRNALPGPDLTEDIARQYDPPRGETEAALAQIWQQLLERTRVGRDEHIFDLGGDSLTIVRMHGLLEQTFQCSLPIVDLFRYPTVRSLAQALEEGRSESYMPDSQSLERARNRRQLTRRRSPAHRTTKTSEEIEDV